WASSMATFMPAASEKSHPPGLYLLFFVELWERFSYYGNRAILSLYMVALASAAGGLQGLGIPREDVPIIYGWYQAFVYLTPLLGGWLADNYIGRRKSVTIGGLMMMSGQLVLASSPTLGAFYAGLALLCLGNG